MVSDASTFRSKVLPVSVFTWTTSPVEVLKKRDISVLVCFTSWGDLFPMGREILGVPSVWRANPTKNLKISGHSELVSITYIMANDSS